MGTIWFVIISIMLAVYVVLDGFDFGAGILHLRVAKTDEERRTVLAAIGPVWDGNEVWLVASGGVLFFSFPKVYAAGFSGFYMPLMMVLWLLILRGLSIDFRSKEENALWRSFWDGTFAFSSVLLAIVLGAALGNVLRGTPVDATGFFSGPLFTDFRTGPQPGALDWYTVLMGILALSILAGHGALYLIWKTAGPVQERSYEIARTAWRAATLFWILSAVATAKVQPLLFRQFFARVWIWPLLLVIPISLFLVFSFLNRKREREAFLASACFILSMLASAAAGLYPNLLVSTLDPHYNLTVYNASASPVGLRFGLVVWSIAILLAVGYFTYLFRSFRGKVSLEDGYGH
jgi:cytochrome d ubiquinol oxidase subunit II